MQCDVGRVLGGCDRSDIAFVIGCGVIASHQVGHMTVSIVIYHIKKIKKFLYVYCISLIFYPI